MAIALDLASVNGELIDIIGKVCRVKPRKTQYCDDPEIIDCFDIDENTKTIYIPMGAWRHFLDTFPELNHARVTIKNNTVLYTIETDPKKYRDQTTIVKEALIKLKKDHTVFIAASPGYGKTKSGSYLACKLGLKIMVVCHIDKVNKQWLSEFKTNTSARVQHITGSKKLDLTASVYIIGVLKLANMSTDAIATLGIGTVIFDEAHVATITAFSRSLLRVCPKYVIGLSATPERSDGMQKLLKMYFGPKKGYIFRQEVKDFSVYKLETDYEPEIRYKMFKGATVMDWTTIINSLAYNTDRQQTIVDTILQHPDHRIMVLSDRIEECVGIYKLLVTAAGGDNGDPSTEVYIMDDSNSKDSIATIQKYRILIAGRKRAGIGFDDPTRDLLVLCTDCKDVRQNEGRIRTSNNIVYDIVDKFSTMENHWKLRRAWYEQRGASVEIIPRSTRLVTTNKNTVSIRRRLPPNKAVE